MFGGEKDPDNGDKVDVIVEVLTITITPSSMCTVPSARCAVTAAWSREAWPGCGRGAWQCWWAAVNFIYTISTRYCTQYLNSIYTVSTRIYTVQVGCVTPDTPLELTGDTLVRGCVTLIGVHNYEHRDLVTAVQVTRDT